MVRSKVPTCVLLMKSSRSPGIASCALFSRATDCSKWKERTGVNVVNANRNDGEWLVMWRGDVLSAYGDVLSACWTNIYCS